MTPPTKEQIEAAKAWLESRYTHAQWDMLAEWCPGASIGVNACTILLAALESAEARILELEEKVESLGYEVQDANNRSAE